MTKIDARDRAMLAACLFALMPVAQAGAQGNAETDRLLLHSADTEWVFSNCDDGQLDAGYLMAAQAVLAQVGAAAEIYRTASKARVEAEYSSTEEACADMRWVALPD